MMQLRPLRAGLTAGQVQLMLAPPAHLFNLGPDAIEPLYLCSRQGQAIGGVVLLAVSDNPYFEAPAEPANLDPVGVSPMLTPCVAIEAAVFLQTTDGISSIVAHSFEAGF